MKKMVYIIFFKLNFYILSFLLCFKFTYIHSVLTTNIATDLDYYDFVDHLRTYSENFLSSLEKCFNSKVYYLKNKHLNRQANVLEDIYRYKMNFYRELFNNIFLNVDEYNVTTGNYLDEYDRSETEKAALIDISKKKLKNDIYMLSKSILNDYNKECSIFFKSK
jgi:hypothetical protein